MPTVRMPDGQLVDMPDNPDPKLLAELQLRMSPTAQPPKQETGILPEAFKGIGRGAIDFVRDVGNKLKGGVPEDMQLQQQPGLVQANQALDKYLAPSPDASGVQYGAGKVGEFAGGALLPGGLGKVASNSAAAFAPRAIDATTQVMRELHEAGIKLGADKMGGAVSNAFTGLGGKARVDTMLRNENVPQFRNLASEATGVPANRITAESLDAANREVANRTYQPLRDLGDIHFGSSNVGGYSSTFHKELDTIASKYKGVPAGKQVEDTIKDLRDFRQLPVDTVLEKLQNIRNEASSAFANGERNAGRAYREIGGAIENQVERNLPMTGNVLEEFRAGRQQIARNHAVEDMLVDKHTGIIDPVKAQKLLEDGVKLDGPLLTIAKAGSKEFASSTKAPTGRAPAFDTSDAWLSGGLGVGGGIASAVTTGGLGGVAAAAIPAARVGMRHGLVSDWGQNAMARGLYDQPSMLGMTPDVLQRLGIGANSMFSQGGQ